jgi:Fur family transcriptional regulator, ferric uptake regulator
MKTIFEEILKRNRMSSTIPRTQVFEVLRGASSPLSVNEIFENTSAIDLSSVYRSLEAFERTGIIEKVSSGFKVKYQLSSIFRPHKHHANCSECGKLVELPEANIEKLISEFCNYIEFTATGHTFEITGKCNKC